MNVSLTPELEALIHEKVESGMYGSASEVVREALRLLQQRDQAYRARLAEIRREIAVGTRQADRGELHELDAATLKAEARRRRKTAG